MSTADVADYSCAHCHRPLAFVTPLCGKTATCRSCGGTFEAKRWMVVLSWTTSFLLVAFVLSLAARGRLPARVLAGRMGVVGRLGARGRLDVAVRQDRRASGNDHGGHRSEQARPPKALTLRSNVQDRRTALHRTRPPDSFPVAHRFLRSKA